MKVSFLRAALIKVSALILSLLACSALAQGALDFEVGLEQQLSGDRAPYVLSRYNLPLGKEIFGAQAWLLPEAGVFLYDQITGYARVQFLIDAPHATLFTDCRYEFAGNGSCRVGARFGF